MYKMLLIQRSLCVLQGDTYEQHYYINPITPTVCPLVRHVRIALLYLQRPPCVLWWDTYEQHYYINPITPTVCPLVGHVRITLFQTSLRRGCGRYSVKCFYTELVFNIVYNLSVIPTRSLDTSEALFSEAKLCQCYSYAEFCALQCSVECGSGVSRRGVFCSTDSTPHYQQEQQDHLCSKDTRPADTKQCTAETSCGPHWFRGMTNEHAS